MQGLITSLLDLAVYIRIMHVLIIAVDSSPAYCERSRTVKFYGKEIGEKDINRNLSIHILPLENGLISLIIGAVEHPSVMW